VSGSKKTDENKERREKNMTKHKRVAAILLAIMMIFTFMPSMAFADDVVLTGANVTTDDTTEAIHYPSFEEALTATNDANNDGKHPVITLLEDAELSAAAVVEIPLTINLNGHKLTETTNGLVPAKGTWGANAEGICRKDTDAEIVFAKHAIAEGIYNWAKRENNDAWHVVGLEEICDNCGSHEEVITTELTGNNPSQTGYQTTPSTPNATGSTTYTFRERYVSRYDRWGNPTAYSWRNLDTKTVDGPEAAKYSLSGTTQIVVVNGVNQHKDGLPVVKAGMVDSVGNAVTPTVTVTAATKAELDATDPAVTVYAENGTSVVSKPYNADPTCTTPGKTTYKVVVADPDGKVVETKYLQDSQAAAKTSHIKGALKGYKLLERSEFIYDSEAAAVTAGGTGVVKVASKTTAGVTKYCYWKYSSLVVIDGTKSMNTIKDVAVATKNLENDGSFTLMPVYFCNFENTYEVNDSAVVISPLGDATTAAQKTDGNHSTCINWAYATKTITYTFGTGTVQSTFTSTLRFNQTDKTSEYFSHVSDGSKYDVESDGTRQPTCELEGIAKVKCAICGDPDVEVTIAKLPDTFGAWTGTGTPAIGSFEIDGTALSGTKHNITLNSDKTEAVVTPTCTQPGGTFKYCTAGDHWVLQGEAVPATGHNLVTVMTGAWSTDPEFAPDYDGEKADYQYRGVMICSNAACDGSFVEGMYPVTFHSKNDTDTLTDKYNAIEIVKEAKGKDCNTEAKTTYTVKGIKDRTGAAITLPVAGGPKGDHVLEVKNFNWSSDFEAATVITKCTFKDCPEHDKTFTKEAEVTKATDTTGLTTFTAKYGDASESKKIYSLKGAKVTYDTSKITDGNLVLGVTGAAAQTPEVTVTLNGTVIDNSQLAETWSYRNQTVGLSVAWNADGVFEDGVTKTTDTVAADTFKVAAKSTFSAPTVTVKKGDVTATGTNRVYNGTYDPSVKWSVVATTTVKGATVKYAVVSEEPKDQAAIDALNYDLTEVNDIKDFGTHYVYAQLSADGYTNYSYRAATITIGKMIVDASIDNFSMKQGETPSFNVVFTERATGKVVTVDPSEYKVTSAGGQELNALLPGDYHLLVTSDNYEVHTAYAEGRVNTVTVLTKEGKTVDQDAADTNKAADYALADANALKASAYTAASYAKVEDATKALKNAILNGSTEDIKAATKNLNDAIEGLVKMKTNPMTVKTKTVKAKAKSTVKNKTGLIVKDAKGTKTFTKVSGNSKIKVNKTTGKITVYKGLKAGKSYKVKIKVKAAGTDLYKAKTVTKVVTVKVS
jgi:hypothetical protein